METEDYTVWTPAELADFLRVNKKTIYDYLKQPGIQLCPNNCVNPVRPMWSG